MAKEIITLSDVSIGYGKLVIAKELSFSVCSDDFIGLVGPNGAGKTTAMRMLCGVSMPSWLHR